MVGKKESTSKAERTVKMPGNKARECGFPEAKRQVLKKQVTINSENAIWLSESYEKCEDVKSTYLTLQMEVIVNQDRLLAL